MATVTETPTTAAAQPISVPKLPLDKWTAIKIAAFGIIAIWSLITIALFWANGVDPLWLIWALWWPAIFVVQFVILTWLWRAVPLKDIVRMFLLGMSVVFVLAYITQYILYAIVSAFPIYDILAADFLLGRADMMAPVVSPITEEICKVLPVVGFLLLAGRGYWKRALGPLDVALLAGAAGAGFMFMENIAKEVSGWWETIGPDRSVYPASFGFGPFHLFPDMYHSTAVVWPGHPETAMFIGLCLGFGLLIRKKVPVFWAVIPALGLLWMIWLHFLRNYLGSWMSQAWVQVVYGLNLNGGLVQYVLILGLLAAIAVSTVTKFLYMTKDKEATLQVVGKETLEYIRANQSQPLLIARKLWSLRHFWSRRHAVAYGAFYARQQKPEEREKWASWLYDLRQQALGKE